MKAKEPVMDKIQVIHEVEENSDGEYDDNQ
jgi:hypothetical protein